MDMQQQQQAAPAQAMPQPAKKGGMLKKVLIGFAVAILAIFTLAIGLGFGLTAKATKTAEEFMSYLSANNVAAAYGMTSQAFRQATAQADLQAIVDQNAFIAGSEKPSFTSRSVENDQATISGTMMNTKGEKAELSVYLVKSGDSWSIHGFDLKPLQ